jgi:hypothetical protein
VYKTRVNHSPKAEMRYCEISTEILSLYFGLAVFRLFEARVPEFNTQPLPPPAVECGEQFANKVRELYICTVTCTAG